MFIPYDEYSHGSTYEVYIYYNMIIIMWLYYAQYVTYIAERLKHINIV